MQDSKLLMFSLGWALLEQTVPCYQHLRLPAGAGLLGAYGAL